MFGFLNIGVEDSSGRFARRGMIGEEDSRFSVAGDVSNFIFLIGGILCRRLLLPTELDSIIVQALVAGSRAQRAGVSFFSFFSNIIAFLNLYRHSCDLYCSMFVFVLTIHYSSLEAVMHSHSV